MISLLIVYGCIALVFGIVRYVLTTKGVFKGYEVRTPNDFVVVCYACILAVFLAALYAVFWPVHVCKYLLKMD